MKMDRVNVVEQIVKALLACFPDYGVEGRQRRHSWRDEASLIETRYGRPTQHTALQTVARRTWYQTFWAFKKCQANISHFY
jgi:hypothetical protein